MSLHSYICLTHFKLLCVHVAFNACFVNKDHMKSKKGAIHWYKLHVLCIPVVLCLLYLYYSLWYWCKHVTLDIFVVIINKYNHLNLNRILWGCSDYCQSWPGGKRSEQSGEKVQHFDSRSTRYIVHFRCHTSSHYYVCVKMHL